MHRMTRWVALMAVAVSATISGCASSPSCDAEGDGYDVVTLCPGASRTCTAAPCTVYYQLPEGTGDYQVTGNGIEIGAYPAGKKVNLGSFWKSYYFDIVGTDLPRARVFIGGSIQ